MFLRGSFVWLFLLTGAWGCTTIFGVNHDYHLECDASAPEVPDAGPACTAAQARIVVTVHDLPGGTDRGALMAVLGGLPSTQVAGIPSLWAAEKVKTWVTIADTVPFQTGESVTYAACVPPGNYVLQLWDRFGGGPGYDNGVPPGSNYPWEIGNSSRTLELQAGSVAQVAVTDTNVDVPDGDAFYGSWSTWDYGPCACDASCPSGTTCASGTCVDLSADIRNCGAPGAACNAADCCQGKCIAPESDDANCGACGHACTGAMTCQSGSCQ